MLGHAPAEAPQYCSFMVRFWLEPLDGAWHGEVEHVQSGRREPVTELPQVLDFLASHGSPATDLLGCRPSQGPRAAGAGGAE
jgi:hypothetical protein